MLLVSSRKNYLRFFILDPESGLFLYRIPDPQIKKKALDSGFATLSAAQSTYLLFSQLCRRHSKFVSIVSKSRPPVACKKYQGGSQSHKNLACSGLPAARSFSAIWQPAACKWNQDGRKPHATSAKLGQFACGWRPPLWTHLHAAAKQHGTFALIGGRIVQSRQCFTSMLYIYLLYKFRNH